MTAAVLTTPATGVGYGAEVTTTETLSTYGQKWMTADERPHEHFALVRRYEEAFAANLAGAVTGFTSTIPTWTRDAEHDDDPGWWFDLANGARIGVTTAGGSGDGGGGVLGQTADTIKWGPVPAIPAPKPADLRNGKVVVAEFMDWLWAVMANAAPMRDGEDGPESVLASDRRGGTDFTVSRQVRYHSNGSTNALLVWAVAPGGRRGEKYTAPEML